MKFAALGRTHWLRDAIRATAARGHQPVLIGTAKAMPEYACTERDFADLAAEFNCPFFEDGSLDSAEAVAHARAAGAEVAISVNWPTIIGPGIRRQFRHGILNAHAGDLPRYRGNACPNWAILAGETHLTVTVHQMAAELDAGPVLLKRRCEITESTYIGDLYAFMTATIPGMFADALDGLANGSLTLQAQSTDPADALRCYPRRPDDGFLDWTQPAEALGRLVRASAEPFAGAYFILNGERVVVWRARVEPLPSPSLGVPGQVVAVRPESGAVGVLTGDGLLVLEVLQPAGSARGPATTFVRSTRDRLGFDAPSEYLRLARRLAERNPDASR